jgi:hypothetical protein
MAWLICYTLFLFYFLVYNVDSVLSDMVTLCCEVSGGALLNKLSDDFSVVLHAVGIDDLKHSVFYNAPIGIRFEIGGEEDIYLNESHGKFKPNPEYISAAVNRSQTIYTHLPAPPDLLRINVYPNEKASAQEIAASICKATEMPQPHEQVLENFGPNEEGEKIPQLQLYWNIGKIAFSPDKIFREIARADIGGYSELTSNVYFANIRTSVLFHMYDDRGADLVAADREMIRPLFEQYNRWILEYDRDRINQTFAK